MARVWRILNISIIEPVRAIVALSLLVSLLLETVGGTPSTFPTSITVSGGGKCEECVVKSNVTRDQDREINVEVTELGAYIRIETVLEDEEPQREPLVFVLRTEFSVKTWRISGAGQYSATLLPTSSSHSNMKLIVSTKSEGNNTLTSRERSSVLFQLSRTLP